MEACTCVYQVSTMCPPPEKEDADLPDFNPEREYLLLGEVYGDLPCHKNR